MSEKPPSSSSKERTPSEEILRVKELLQTPNVTIAIFGTGEGISVPFYFKTGLPDKEGKITVSHVQGDTVSVPPNLGRSLFDLRGEPEVLKAFAEQGFYRKNLQVGSQMYAAFYVPSFDFRDREGMKGVFVGWDSSDAGLHGKMDIYQKRIAPVTTLTKLWSVVYKNADSFASSSNLEVARSAYYSPPDISNPAVKKS